jgi:hypothetical protein
MKMLQRLFFILIFSAANLIAFTQDPFGYQKPPKNKEKFRIFYLCSPLKLTNYNTNPYDYVYEIIFFLLPYIACNHLY